MYDASKLRISIRFALSIRNELLRHSYSNHPPGEPEAFPASLILVGPRPQGGKIVRLHTLSLTSLFERGELEEA